MKHPPQGSAATSRADELTERVDAALSQMPPDSRLKFAEQLAGRRARPKETAVQLLASLLADGEHLARLVAPLPADARVALELLCEAEGAVAAETLIALVAGLQDERRARAAVVQLLRSGLLLTMTARPSVSTWRPPASLLLLEPIARALQPMFDAWWLQEHGAATEQDHPSGPLAAGPALMFQDGVLLAHLCQSRPRVTNDEALHAQDTKKLLTLFGPLDERALRHSLDTLKRLGLLLRSGDGRVSVDTKRADMLLADGGAGASAALRRSRLQTLSPAARQALALLWRRPGWQGRVQVETMVCAWERSVSFDLAPEYYFYQQDPIGLRACPGQSTRLAIDALVDIGFVEADPAGQALRLGRHERWLRQLIARGDVSTDAPSVAAADEAVAGQRGVDQARPPAATCHLQPNFELIVPPETSAHDLLQIGRIAQLERSDQIASFRLTERSVRAAAAGGLVADQIIDLLQRLAQHGVPENVERGVRDFAGCARTAHLLERQVVVLVRPELADEAAAAGLTPGPVPGVFVADKRGLALRALERAGFTVPAVAEAASGKAWRLGELRLPQYAIDGDADYDAEFEAFFDVDEAEAAPGCEVRDVSQGDVSLAGCVRAIAPLRTIPCPPPCPSAAAALDDVAVEQALAQLCGRGDPSNVSERASAKNGGSRHDDCSGRERALAQQCEDLASLLDVAPVEVSLLVHALGSAPRRWLRQLDGFLLGAELPGFRDASELTTRLLHDPDIAEAVLEFAQRADKLLGPLDAGAAILGDDTVALALARNRDLWVAKADGQIVRLTPHLADMRCRNPFVSGELVEEQETHVFRFDDTWFALGPRSDADQLQRAALARGEAPADVGRNSPCPCGSGRKYKKCCMKAASTPGGAPSINP